MVRYQERLKTYLLRREDNLNIKLREADNELKVNDISFSSPMLFFHIYSKFVNNVKHSV
jgi:hypothetical protein